MFLMQFFLFDRRLRYVFIKVIQKWEKPGRLWKIPTNKRKVITINPINCTLGGGQATICVLFL